MSVRRSASDRASASARASAARAPIAATDDAEGSALAPSCEPAADGWGREHASGERRKKSAKGKCIEDEVEGIGNDLTGFREEVENADFAVTGALRVNRLPEHVNRKVDSSLPGGASPCAAACAHFARGVKSRLADRATR